MTTTTPTSPPFAPHIEAYIEAVATRAARKAVEDALGGIGIDITTPAGLRDEHADRAFLRSARMGVKSAGAKTLLTIIGAAATGIAFLIWSAIHNPGQ